MKFLIGVLTSVILTISNITHQFIQADPNFTIDLERSLFQVLAIISVLFFEYLYEKAE